MTPAVQLLKKHKAEFELLEYQSDPSQGNFGLASAEKLGLEPEQVFKTLLAVDEHNPKQMVVAIVPVSGNLDLKALAKAAGYKKMAMCELAQAERVTGYIKGGISPFAQKKRLATFIDQSAAELPYVYVSAGKRGLSLKVTLACLGQYCGAKTAALAS